MLPFAFGLVLMGVGALVASIYLSEPTSLANGTKEMFYLHPYVFEGLAVFGVGAATQFFGYLMEY
jgi:hypothetical protein